VGPAPGRIEDDVRLNGRVVRLATLVAATGAVGLCPAAAAGQTSQTSQTSQTTQTSRAAVVAEAQAEKARQLRPERPGLLERVLGRLDARGDAIARPIGVYPWFGSIYSSGAIAAGAGVRAPFRDTGAVDVKAAWSVRRFKMVDAELRLPLLASGRLDLRGRARWMDAPAVPFYGVGDDSRRADRATYALRSLAVGADGRVRAFRHVWLGGGLEHSSIDTGRGGSGLPSIEDRFTPDTAPGLGFDGGFLAARAFAAYDWRDAPGYTQRGGLYRLAVARYTDRESGAHSFRRVDVDLRQFLPAGRDQRVIGLRALVTTIDAGAGRAAPYFLLPSLGGGDELRSYSTLRFRAPHVIVLGAEYRWMPARILDMAVFADAGKAVSRRRDLDLGGLRRSVGVGARFHTARDTLLRLEVAHGAEGFHFVLNVGPAF
jgi:hypothetical protein